MPRFSVSFKREPTDKRPAPAEKVTFYITLVSNDIPDFGQIEHTFYAGEAYLRHLELVRGRSFLIVDATAPTEQPPSDEWKFRIVRLALEMSDTIR